VQARVDTGTQNDQAELAAALEELDAEHEAGEKKKAER
jgi:hypothetical protein